MWKCKRSRITKYNPDKKKLGKLILLGSKTYYKTIERKTAQQRLRRQKRDARNRPTHVVTNL